MNNNISDLLIEGIGLLLIRGLYRTGFPCDLRSFAPVCAGQIAVMSVLPSGGGENPYCFFSLGFA
jgi:hypothetical protein